MKLLSIHLPSNRPFFFRRLATSLAERASDRDCFEIVVKIDENDPAMQAEVEAIKRDLRIAITPVVSPPPRDYYDLSRFCNDCLAAADPLAYFCWHVNDEVTVETENWDKMLRDYIGLFSDDLFRLKISPGKMFRNFFDIHEVNLYADYPITTRRWLDLTDGWVHGHGAEPYQEAIAFVLAQRNIHRNVALPMFKLGGDEPGQNISERTAALRNQQMQYHWDNNMMPTLRERINRGARRIEMTIFAIQMGEVNFTLQENERGKYITLVTAKQTVLSRLWFNVDPLWIHILNLRHIAHRNVQVWPHSLWGKPGWYRALIKAWRVGSAVGDFFYMTLYLPIAACFGAPIRCWYAQSLERFVIKHWNWVTSMQNSLGRRAPWVKRRLGNLYFKAREQGWIS